MIAVHPPRLRAALGSALALLVLRGSPGVARADGEIVRELIDKVRQQIGPVASFKTALVVKRLPKTRSGKILRGTMKRIAESQAYTAPATIDDPAILDEITEALRSAGYAKGGP